MLPSLPTILRGHAGPLPPLTDAQRSLAAALRQDVTVLATDIGPRNTYHPRAYHLAADFLETALSKLGLATRRQTFDTGGVPCHNIEATLRGTRHPDRVVVVGAHYDSVGRGCPAANDNGSGVAATLAIARALAGTPMASTVRFVVFANEEPPHFLSQDMGSLVYARACRERADDIRAMLCMETIGCYSHERGTQRWPPSPLTKLLPDVGDFILMVGNTESKTLVRAAHDAFVAHTTFPSLAAAVPAWAGEINWSDHWSFYQCGYPALLVTDTAPFRYPHYHLPTDTPDKLDYESTARVVEGFVGVTRELASAI